MTDLNDTDEALLRAAHVGLVAERVGVPLVPWQQRVIDGVELKREAERAWIQKHPYCWFCVPCRPTTARSGDLPVCDQCPPRQAR